MELYYRHNVGILLKLELLKLSEHRAQTTVKRGGSGSIIFQVVNGELKSGKMPAKTFKFFEKLH